MRKIVYVLIALLLISVAVNVAQWRVGVSKTEHTTDTIVRTDTVRDSVPVLRESVVVRREVVRLPLAEIQTDNRHDTLYVTDSVAVEVPITQSTYSDDSTYTAWVSGYLPRLDSIEVYRRTMEIRYPKKPPRRWGFGLQAGFGYGFGNNKAQPYVGVGVSYNLISW